MNRAVRNNFNAEAGPSWYDGLANFFRGGIRTNEQARSAGQPYLSPTASRVSNNDIIPARIQDYGGGLAGGVDPMQIIAAANAAARNVPAPVAPSNSDFMAKLAADASEAEAIKEMGVDDSIKEVPTKTKRKKRKTSKKNGFDAFIDANNKAPKLTREQEAINKSAGIVPKRRMTHADRLNMLDPYYANDNDYMIIY